MKIALLGIATDSGNRGVHALGASTINLFLNANPAAEIVLMLENWSNEPVPFRVGDGLRKIRLVNVRMSPRSRFRDHFFVIVFASMLYKAAPLARIRRWIAAKVPWVHELATADLVGDIRGGDSFSDIYGMERFIRGFLLAWTVILVRGSIVQLPQTYGPFKKPIARALARHLLKNSAAIIARDKASQAVAQALVPARKVDLTPDVAFSLRPVKPSSVNLAPPLPPHETPPVVGVNINGLMYNGGYTRKNMFGLTLDYREFAPKLIKALLQNTASEIWLTPHTWAPVGSVESDNGACFEVQALIPENIRSRVRVLNQEYDANEVKAIIGACDFFVGSRMHSCIAALSQGVPCVGVAYSMKFRGVFESVGVADWVIDGSVTSTGDAINDILKLYQVRESARGRLLREVGAAREVLSRHFEAMVETTTTARRRTL